METNKVTELVLENIENLLVEGRVEDIKNKWPQESWGMIDSLVEIDPSKTNKFLEWTTKMYTSGKTIKWFKDNAGRGGYHSWSLESVPDTSEDNGWSNHVFNRNIQTSLNGNKLSELKDSLEHFFKNPSKYEIKDINQFRTKEEFEDAVELAKTKLSRKEMKDTGVDKVFEDDRFILLMPKTHKAACRYGSRTRWCVTMRNHSGYFENYFGQGPIFFLVDKSQPEQQQSPQYMYEAPDYWKLAIHYKPFNGRLDQKGSRALSYAKTMDKETFMAGADIGNTSIDYWNVQDHNKKESVVGKYLGGPGRGQTQRAEAVLNSLKSLMQSYTKKIMGKYYDSLDMDTDALDKVQELKVKRDEVKSRQSNMYYKIDRLDTVNRNLRNFRDRLENDGDDKYSSWVEKQKEKAIQYLSEMREEDAKLRVEIDELNDKIKVFEEKMSSEGLVFYDKEKNVSM